MGELRERIADTCYEAYRSSGNRLFITVFVRLSTGTVFAYDFVDGNSRLSDEGTDAIPVMRFHEIYGRKLSKDKFLEAYGEHIDDFMARYGHKVYVPEQEEA